MHSFRKVCHNGFGFETTTLLPNGSETNADLVATCSNGQQLNGSFVVMQCPFLSAASASNAKEFILDPTSCFCYPNDVMSFF